MLHHPSCRLALPTTTAKWFMGLAAGLYGLGAAHAQGVGTVALEPDTPYYLGAGLGLTYDSNVTRLSSNGPSDVFTTTSVLGGINQTFSRQRVYLDGNIARNRYQDVKSLDNTSYGLNTGLQWETIHNLSGNIRYGLTQNLADPALTGTPSDQRNSQKTQLVGAAARYEISRRMAFEAGLQRRQIDYSALVFAPLENTQNVANVGVVYGLSGLMTVGLGLRASQLDTPRYNALGANEADRTDVDLTLSWSPSGLSTVNARISASKEEHSLATASDFSGITGNLSWDYQPSGRSRFTTSFLRDTGSESRFAGFAEVPGPTGTTALGTLSRGPSAATEIYRVTHTLEGRFNYLLTSKITTNFSLSRSRGSLVGNGVNTTGGRDNVNMVGLGVNYLASRSLSLGCRLSRESRSTTSTLSSSYSTNMVGCLGTFYLS